MQLTRPIHMKNGQHTFRHAASHLEVDVVVEVVGHVDGLLQRGVDRNVVNSRVEHLQTTREDERKRNKADEPTAVQSTSPSMS